MTTSNPAPIQDDIQLSDAPGDPQAASALSARLQTKGLTVRAFPVFDLRRRAASTFFCVPAKVSTAGNAFGHWLLQAFDEDAIASIDLELLDAAIVYAKRFAGANLVAAIGTAVAFSTLTRNDTRRAYLDRLNAARELSTTPLVVKVDLFPRGTPTSRFSEIVKYLKQGVRRVFVSVPDVNDRTWNPGEIGAAGLGLLVDPQDGPDAIADKARALIALCASQGGVSYMDGLVLRESADAATAAGVRFGTGPALSFTIFPLNGGLPKIPFAARA